MVENFTRDGTKKEKEIAHKTPHSPYDTLLFPVHWSGISRGLGRKGR